MNKQQLLKLAYPLGKYVSLYTGRMAESGYQVCEIYQNDALSYAENINQNEALRNYWVERAMEEFASTHQRYNMAAGIYPNDCQYRSDLISNLRKNYSGNHELQPILNKKYLTEIKNEVIKYAFMNKIREQKNVEIKEHNITDIADFYDVDLPQKKQLLFDWFILTAEKSGYDLDKERSSNGFPVLTLNHNSTGVDVCCFISTQIRYEISSVNTYVALIPKADSSKVKDLYKNLNQNSPFVELKPIFLVPGFHYYNWMPIDIKDVLLSIKASLELFKIVSNEL